MKQLDKRSRDFIEKMGLSMERMGAARTFGRIFGLLLVADVPLSLEDMAEYLQVSKPSISTNVRQFEQAKFAERISYPGDRRHYYMILPGAIERTMFARLPLLTEMAELMESGLEAIGEDNTIARQRLEETRDFYAFLGKEVTSLIAKWQNQKQGANGVSK